jgi:hypothetical protein
MPDQQVTITRGARLASAVLRESSIEDLRASLNGPLLRPGEAGYDAARKIWNGMIDKRPAMIARCRGVGSSWSDIPCRRRVRYSETRPTLQRLSIAAAAASSPIRRGLEDEE